MLIFCDSFNSVFLHDFWLCMFRHTYILTINKRSFLLFTNKIAPNFLTPCILSLGDGLPPSIVDAFSSHLDPSPPYLHLAAQYTQGLQQCSHAGQSWGGLLGPIISRVIEILVENASFLALPHPWLCGLHAAVRFSEVFLMHMQGELHPVHGGGLSLACFYNSH